MNGLDAGSNGSRVLRLVSLMPGLHLRELQRLLGLSFNTTRYHVDILSKAGAIECQKDKGYLRVYPVGTPEKAKTIYSCLRKPSSRLILTALAQEPIVTGKQLCERTGLAKSTVSELIQEFVASQIVKVEFSDVAGFGYDLTDRDYLLQILLNQQQKRLLETATDRFIDLWDM